MTKTEAVVSLKRIKKVLADIEVHDVSIRLDQTNLKQRAHREKTKIQDIIGLIEKLDR